MRIWRGSSPWSLLAAWSLGRRYLGIELDAECYAAAKRRLAPDVVNPPPLHRRASQADSWGAVL